MKADSGVATSSLSSLRKQGTQNPRERLLPELVTASLRQTTSCGYGSRIGARLGALVRDDSACDGFDLVQPAIFSIAA
jgi:hypothetical protein